MFFYLIQFKSYRNHQKKYHHVRNLLKVVLEIICSQRHLAAISVLHLSRKGIYLVPGFISAFSYFHPLAHSGLCVGQTSWSHLPKICKLNSLYTNYVVPMQCSAVPFCCMDLLKFQWSASLPLFSWLKTQHVKVWCLHCTASAIFQGESGNLSDSSTPASHDSDSWQARRDAGQLLDENVNLSSVSSVAPDLKDEEIPLLKDENSQMKRRIREFLANKEI